MWPFSKKVKSADAFVVFASTIPNMDIAGCASKEYPGVWKIGYTQDDKDLAIYTMNSTYKKWALRFEYTFNRDVQFVKVTTTVKNLSLGDSNDGETEMQREISEKFPKFSFIFYENERRAETGIYFSPRTCKKLDDVKAILEEFRTAWNESGFLAFIDERF